MKRKAQWSYRIYEEKKRSLSSCFITLTYADEFLTIGDDGPTINKNDHFDFIKNLKELESPDKLSEREIISKEEVERMRSKTFEFSTGFNEKAYKISYYGVSEYGDQFSRPHWHYLLFNIRDFNNIVDAWRQVLYDEEGNKCYGKSKGIVQIDECNQNTIDYVLKYMVKDHTSKDYENRQKEISFMSKGIGLKDEEREFITHIKRADGNRIVNSRGHKVAVPRYYRKKYLTDQENAAKVLYISKEVEKQNTKFETNAIGQGLNPDLLVKQQKDNRNHLLKDRKNRELR